MNRIATTLVLSGAAAAAVLGTAATASADSPEAATATVQASIDRAAGAPVSLPDGRTLHIRGLDSVSYRADATHRTAVVQLASGTATEPGGTTGIDQGVGSNPQQTGTGIGNGVQTGVNPNQIQNQAASGGAIGGTAVAALVLGIIVWVLVKKSGLKVSWAVACVALGVLLSPTFVGPLVGQLTGSGVSAFGNIWGGIGQ